MSHYVYFVRRVGKGNSPVKIGYSKDPESRCKKLQTANSDKLKVCVKLPFDTEEEAREAERAFHWLARKMHKGLQGEWFMIYGSWKHFIAKAMKIYDGNQKAKGR